MNCRAKQIGRKLISKKQISLFVHACMAVLLVGCTNLLYAPDSHLYVDPDKLTPKPEEVKFTAESSNGVNELGGWYFRSQSKPKAVIVYFHGNGQNRSAHFAGLYWIVKEGYDLFIFDYPGYGDVGGKASPENTVAAGKAALLYVRDQMPSTPLIVYGQSLGGAVAMRTMIELKGQIEPKLFVADSTFLSYRSAARKVLSNHWLTWLLQPVGWLVMNDDYAPVDRVKEISPIPMLVIHSKHDHVIDFSLGEEVFARAAEPKEFWQLESGRHIETFSSADMIYALKTRKRFLAKLDQVLLPAKP